RDRVGHVVADLLVHAVSSRARKGAATRSPPAPGRQAADGDGGSVAPVENDFQFRYACSQEEGRLVNWIPLIGVVLFVGLGVGWRSWLQRRRHGSSGIVLFRSGDLAQHVREAGILVLVPLLAAEAIACAVAPGSLERFRIAPS